MTHRHGRIDGTQREMMDAARAAGAHVFSMADMGDGFPDLLIYCPWSDSYYLIECKSKCGRLTDAQQRWHTTYPALSHVCYSVEELLAIIGRA